ncbi:thymic stromal cotransporter homolog [Cyclopterus lumpus]|uniref:Solute carrier family 46 member 2 n=1 Tax=Cyclopterus lumpus TaxID=8103 RepID=A0A8C2Z3F2_CYCLU|nr:thymic stromal cotransporter homolog [Cyclopterus lumpus]
MVTPSLCQSAFAVLRRIEPTLVLEQLGSSLFATALQMVVKDRCVNASYPDAHLSVEASQQRAMTDFYMTYNLIVRLVPILPALILARLGDRGWRRVPIAVPLVGYVLLSLALLLVVVVRLPLEVMFGAGVVFGLSGGFGAYWPGVMTLVALSSTAAERSKVMMTVELLYGTAGLVGSLASGHLFLLYSSSLGTGTILIIVGALLQMLCLTQATFLLQVKPECHQETEDTSRLLPDTSGKVLSEVPSEVPSKVPSEVLSEVSAPAKKNRVNVILLVATAILYGSAVSGAVEIMEVFVLKEPLNWSATQVGYGHAAGYMIFLTSFLGVTVFRRCVSDVALILIGMLSFASGIYFMTFVRTTSMFYLARSLNLFALIPMPTIRSLLSQQVPASSCGTTLTYLQMALKFSGLAYIPAFTKIYQRTLDWLPGFVFTLSSVITVLGMIPISIVGWRSRQNRKYTRIQVD